MKRVLIILPFLLIFSACAPTDGTGTSPGGGNSSKPAGKSGKSAANVVFKVSGKGKPDITYGSDSDNSDGGHKIPFTKQVKLDKDAVYYYVSAQLTGGGSLTCTVTIGDMVAKGTASGGYNICHAQLVSNGFGGWQKA